MSRRFLENQGVFILWVVVLGGFEALSNTLCASVLLLLNIVHAIENQFAFLELKKFTFVEQFTCKVRDITESCFCLF